MEEREKIVRGYLQKHIREKPSLQTDAARAHFREFWTWLKGHLPHLTTGYAVKLVRLEVEEYAPPVPFSARTFVLSGDPPPVRREPKVRVERRREDPRQRRLL